MKTIRLLYPDHVSGGLETYYFGANLLRFILPENDNRPSSEWRLHLRTVRRKPSPMVYTLKMKYLPESGMHRQSSKLRSRIE